MKHIYVFLAFFLFAVQPVYANEGRIVGKNGSVTCEGVSVWDNVSYKIFGRCQGLTYPFAERLDRYSIWVVPEFGGDPKRLGEVNTGLFDVRSDLRFTRVLVSAESSSNPRVPSSVVVMDAAVSAYDFSSNAIMPVVTQAPAVNPSVSPAALVPENSSRNPLTGPNAPPLNVILLGILAAVVLAVILFLRK